MVRRGKAAAFYNAAAAGTDAGRKRRRGREGGRAEGWTKERSAIKSVCIDYVYCAPVSVPAGNAERNTRASPFSITRRTGIAAYCYKRGETRRFAEVAR